MKKKLFNEANVWLAPPRRATTTEAPSLRRNMALLAMAVIPARSINALICAVTSEK
jgi:hypothetical protein